MSNLSENGKTHQRRAKGPHGQRMYPCRHFTPEQKAASDKRRADEKEAKLNAILDGICSRLNELEGKEGCLRCRRYVWQYSG